MIEPLHLTIAVRTHGHTAALKDGRVTMDGVVFDFIEVEPQIAAFRRMVRDIEFDVCELAPTTYIIAKAFGIAPYTALPIFFERRFHHAGLVVRPDSGINAPKDLEGRKVGVRAYSVTTGVWTRGILVNEFGVDSSKITWVVDDEEHVTQLTLPPNVTHVAKGNSLADMMVNGEIQAGFLANAGIGRKGAPGKDWNASAVPAAENYHELFPNADQLGAEWYRRTGIYPMHSTLVIKDSILKAHPDVAQKIYRAFVEAKEIYLKDLHAGKATGKVDKRMLEQTKVVGPDPLPYGIAVNRPAIDALRLYAVQQGLAPRDVPVDELFIDTDKF